jgi:hypothetical protein
MKIIKNEYHYSFGPDYTVIIKKGLNETNENAIKVILTLGTQEVMVKDSLVQSITFADLIITGPNWDTPNNCSMNDWGLTVEVDKSKYGKETNLLSYNLKPFSFFFTDPINGVRVFTCKPKIYDIGKLLLKFEQYTKSPTLTTATHDEAFSKKVQRNEQLKEKIKKLTLELNELESLDNNRKNQSWERRTNDN